MGTGASQIFTEQVREALEILGVGAGKAYLETGMNDQVSNLTFGNQIEFDQQRIVDASGRIAQSSGAGQLSGIFTLAANRVYLCLAQIHCTFSAGGFAGFKWRDITNATEFGNQSQSSAAAVGTNTFLGQAYGIIAPSTLITAHCRINFAPSNLTNILGDGPDQETFAQIFEIG